MFYFTFAKIVQMRIPVGIRRKIVRHTFRQKNVPGIAAIHHPLRHVDSRAGNIRPITNINDRIHRAAVNSHS